MPLLEALRGGLDDRSVREERKRKLTQTDRTLDLQGARDKETERKNRFKNHVNLIGQLVDTITNRDLPDNMQIDAANKYQELKGSSVRYGDITEIDRVEKVFQKYKNLKKQYDKGDFGIDKLVEFERGLDAELSIAQGRVDSLKPSLGADTKKAQREYDNKVFQYAEILRKINQGRRATTKDAAFMVEIDNSDSSANQAIRRDGIRESKKEQGSGGFKNVGNAIGAFITQRVNAGDTLEEAITKAKKIAPPSEMEKLLQRLDGNQLVAGDKTGLNPSQKFGNPLGLTDEEIKHLEK